MKHLFLRLKTGEILSKSWSRDGPINLLSLQIKSRVLRLLHCRSKYTEMALLRIEKMYSLTKKKLISKLSVIPNMLITNQEEILPSNITQNVFEIAGSIWNQINAYLSVHGYLTEAIRIILVSKLKEFSSRQRDVILIMCAPI